MIADVFFPVKRELCTTSDYECEVSMDVVIPGLTRNLGLCHIL